MKFGLPDDIVEKINDVLGFLPRLDEAIIYGSRAKGTFREGSDIDIALKGTLSHQDLFMLENKLEDLMLPYTFDLSIYANIANEELRQHIDRVGKIFFRRRSSY